MKSKRIIVIGFIVVTGLLICSCNTSPKNEYKNNTPTSGQLKVYYDEGLEPQIKNQGYTFEALYPNVKLHLFCSSESQAIQALFNDSCEAIVISRLLNAKEKKVFESKKYFPKYSAVAHSGIALICNTDLPLRYLSYEALISLLSVSNTITDSTGKATALTPVFDSKNSSVLHYLMDSLLKGKSPAPFCTTLNSSREAINYVAAHPHALAFIDFAWISDVDDSLVLANTSKIRVLGMSSHQQPGRYEWPSQSSFKLNTYPLTRTVYVLRKTGDFTLAKGFESFVAGPKGQITFLKQGLLPTKQQERSVHINFEPLKTE